MRRRTSLSVSVASVAALLVAGLTGCQKPADPAPVAPLPPAVVEPAKVDLAAIRAEYAKVDATVKVGLVGEVASAEKTLLVTELTDADLALGDVVTIANAQGEKIADGKVTLRGLKSGVGVSYENATREPAAGDIVVRFAQ
jgi:hypothetical protein